MRKILLSSWLWWTEGRPKGIGDIWANVPSLIIS